MKKTLVLFCLCMILLPNEALALEKRSSKKECTLCHVRWLEAFESGARTLLERKDTSIIVSEATSEVTTPEMCLSCHDGYVADSRMRLAKGNKHHALKKVPKGLELPKGFRLNMKGEFYCGTCHGFHDIEANGKIGEVPFVRLPNERSQMCIACHREKEEEPKKRNHSVLVKPKRPPSAKLLDRQAKFGPGEVVICQSCHTPHGAQVSVAPVEDSKLCLFCHADKENTGSLLATGRPLHPVNIKPERDFRKGAGLPEQAKQGPGGELICVTCHSPHQGRSPSILVVENTADFCQRCHEKEVNVVSGTKHNLLNTAPQSKNVRGRSPEASGMCETCHLAHGWAQETPQGADPISGACLSCHRKDGWAHKDQVGEFSHPVDVAVDPREAKTDLPLLSRKGESRMFCVTCHNPHAYWPGPEQRPQPLDADGDPTNSFLRMPGPALCLQCHEDHGLVENTKHDLRRFDKPLEEDYRALLASGGPCFGCHLVHNAYAKKIWFQPLPQPTGVFDREEACRRCLVCHSRPSMKRIQEKRGHPVGKEIGPEYMPRPPDKLKVGTIVDSTGEKPILLCTTCHIPHAARNPDGVITLFAGGGFPKQELCTTCHWKNRWVIGSPHDFRTRKAGEYIPDGGRSRKWGVCAGCHANHEAKSEKRLLWFKIPKPKGKGNPEDMLCLYCHADPRIKKNKWMRFYAHPKGAELHQGLVEKIKKGEIPSVAKIGGPEAASLFGFETLFAVRCVTCHDNHQWVARPNDVNGKEYVSTEMTSFLKGSIVARQICSRCHGLEALYRYRFFHEERIFRLKIPNE